nr:alpha/beta hydrolase [Solirubrobacterales bacterium]
MRPARSLLLAGASLLLMMAPPALAEPRAPTPAAAIERGLLYAVPDGLPLAMDLAHPARTPRRGAPAVVLVHGGGFHSGARGRMRPYLRPLAAAGFVAATIDYRLLPHAEVLDRGLEASSAFAQEDAETAIRFLRENAVRFGIDPQRIVILGASAGGITALNVAARATGPARVQAAVAIAGFGPVADLDGGDPPLLMFHGTAD